MSRRRYISTSISLDKAVNRLAREAGDFAVLLYTWMIPHSEDSAYITGDVEELMLTVCPGFRHKTEDDIADALVAMDRIGLIAWDRSGAIVYFDTESYYRHQSYIPEAKRADNSDYFTPTPQNAAERRETPQNAASLSPSPSPSSTSSAADAADGFLVFWTLYPRKVGRADCLKRWGRLTKKDREVATAAAANLADWQRDTGTELQYVPHPATFIGPKRTFEDWASGWPAGYKAGDSTADPEPTCPICAKKHSDIPLTPDEKMRPHCAVCGWVAP